MVFGYNEAWSDEGRKAESRMGSAEWNNWGQSKVKCLTQRSSGSLR